MTQPLACILGGTGFVGQRLVAGLSACGYRCRVPTRRAHRHRALKLYPEVELRPVERLDLDTLTDCLAGCELAVNLVGMLDAPNPQVLLEAHVTLVERLLAAARAAGVPRLLHMSALRASADGPSDSLRTKGTGEALALAASDIAVTSFRPSVIFGPGDRLFNRFAEILSFAPGLLPLACSQARFAPVWVGDVVEAMCRALREPTSIGRGYDLCGPRIFTLRELVEYTAHCLGRRVRVLELSERAARWQARLLGALPGQPFSLDVYHSLQIDSLCLAHNGLLELGIHPVAVEVEVPGYLSPAATL